MRGRRAEIAVFILVVAYLSYALIDLYLSGPVKPLFVGPGGG